MTEKLTPEEEKIFDEQYQIVIDAYAQAGDFLKTHKQEFKEITEKVKEVLLIGGLYPPAPPLRPRDKTSTIKILPSYKWDYKIR